MLYGRTITLGPAIGAGEVTTVVGCGAGAVTTAGGAVFTVQAAKPMDAVRTAMTGRIRTLDTSLEGWMRADNFRPSFWCQAGDRNSLVMLLIRKPRS
jgi:hypothetical protein